MTDEKLDAERAARHERTMRALTIITALAVVACSSVVLRNGEPLGEYRRKRAAERAEREGLARRQAENQRAEQEADDETIREAQRNAVTTSPIYSVGPAAKSDREKASERDAWLKTEPGIVYRACNEQATIDDAVRILEQEKRVGAESGFIDASKVHFNTKRKLEAEGELATIRATHKAKTGKALDLRGVDCANVMEEGSAQ